MNLREKPPCYSCDRHAEACHATCAAYLGWAEARRQAGEERKRQISAGREADIRLIDRRIARKKRDSR